MHEPPQKQKGKVGQLRQERNWRLISEHLEEAACIGL